MKTNSFSSIFHAAQGLCGIVSIERQVSLEEEEGYRSFTIVFNFGDDLMNVTLLVIFVILQYL